MCIIHPQLSEVGTCISILFCDDDFPLLPILFIYYSDKTENAKQKKWQIQKNEINFLFFLMFFFGPGVQKKYKTINIFFFFSFPVETCIKCVCVSVCLVSGWCHRGNDLKVDLFQTGK